MICCGLGHEKGIDFPRGFTLLAIVRLFVILAVMAVLVVGSMLALSELVEPEQRDYTVAVPANRFNK